MLQGCNRGRVKPLWAPGCATGCHFGAGQHTESVHAEGTSACPSLNATRFLKSPPTRIGEIPNPNAMNIRQAGCHGPHNKEGHWGLCPLSTGDKRTLTLNIAAQLRIHGGRPMPRLCNDTKLQATKTHAFYYLDVALACDARHQNGDTSDTVAETAHVIIEALPTGALVTSAPPRRN